MSILNSHFSLPTQLFIDIHVLIILMLALRFVSIRVEVNIAHVMNACTYRRVITHRFTCVRVCECMHAYRCVREYMCVSAPSTPSGYG